VLLIIVGSLGLNMYTMEKDREIHQLMIFSDRSSFNICAQQGGRSTILIEQDSTLKMPSYFKHHYLGRMNTNVAFHNATYKDYNIHCINDFLLTEHHLHLLYSKAVSRYSGMINVSSLIINKEEPQNLYRFYENIKFSTLVIYQRPEKHINYYRNFCDKNGIKLHLVYKDGAYLKEL
jgi:hypothetical protein